ncbi:group-specific protein [Halobacillus salinus]|uniref:group-specific protein n=1 Tax=Halobacillus salinus TaxID=192814 RepID=UPI0009A908E2|nr:group-specific protein [Halobacillus salinus]
MKKFYVASSFQNKDKVRYVQEELKRQGFAQTYDWTRNERASTSNDLRAIGNLEKEAVTEADFLIVLLPAGKGSHIEFGIALGLGKKIFLHAPDGQMDDSDTTTTFYHVPEVEPCTGSVDELIARVIENEE